MPFGSCVAGRLIGISGLPLGILVLCSTMPAASAGQLFAEKYDARVDMAAKGVSVSTIVCIAAIPQMLILLGL